MDANGGSWAFRFTPKNKNPHQRNNNDRDQKMEAANSANYAWYHSVLNMIGNNFNHSEDICGLVINIKKGGRGKIELWIKDAQTQKNVEIEFQSFESQLKRGRGNKEKLKL